MVEEAGRWSDGTAGRTVAGLAALAAALLAALVAACETGRGTDPAAEAPVWREVAASYGTTCAVDGAGAVLCASTYPRVPIPRLTPVLTGDRFTNPVAASGAVCALDPAGLLRCRALDGRAYPLADDGIAFRQLAGDPDAGCGVATDGAVHCWRPDAPPDDEGRRHPTRVTGVPALAAVAVGNDFACALAADGAAYCWATVPYGAAGGQLGHGARASSRTPVRVRTEERFVRLTAGASHACALTAAGEAWCWGSNGGLELGVPNDGARADCYATGLADPGSPSYGCTTPQRVTTALRFREVRAGAARSCALAPDGRAHCWGANQSHALGVDTPPGGASCRLGAHYPCTAAPVAVSGGLAFTALGPARGMHQCAVTAEGRAYCWGDVSPDGVPTIGNFYGGSATPVPLPATASR